MLDDAKLNEVATPAISFAELPVSPMMADVKPPMRPTCLRSFEAD